jgi:hypothetical protein
MQEIKNKLHMKSLKFCKTLNHHKTLTAVEISCVLRPDLAKEKDRLFVLIS